MKTYYKTFLSICSYTTSPDAYAMNNTQIAADLVALIKSFMKSIPKFRKVPLYIFSESYGGKMTAGFAQALHAAVEAGLSGGLFLHAGR